MSANTQNARRHDIDALRVMSFGTVIIYHASLLYGTRNWLLNSDEPNRLVDLIHIGSHPWRMSLLFFISGLVTASLLNRRSVDDIRRSRTRQLILPFLFGVLVVVPPQAYFSTLRVSPDLSYWDFLKTYLVSQLTLQHMWFLVYLWIYVFIWSIALSRLQGRWPKISAGFAALLRGPNLFLVPILFLSILRIWLYPAFGETQDITRDVYAHCLYLSMFLAGALLMNQPAFWQEIDRWRWVSFSLALSSFLVLAIVFIAVPREHLSEVLIAALRVLRSTFQWCTIIALLAFAARFANRPNPVVKYLNRSIMTYYVMHQTVIIIVAYYFAEAGMLDLWSFVPIVLLTALICALLAEMKKFASVAAGIVVSKLAPLRGMPSKPPSSEAIG
ncbi:acyltransferase family protein [Rhizobiales bacterium RZME27]|uniref:Acyltransferase family protein n=1 Tax=Endobacterium cereale TaxID=2663029 RepID=A0A6A8AFR4_9HYPH|nr:acyltransferase [Endobacterium cereale]MEB2846971.1 acyltransferase [Endobacterium cereale]MQY47611.1 acyltransferase family protein [Endobacterium cereale]